MGAPIGTVGQLVAAIQAQLAPRLPAARSRRVAPGRRTGAPYAEHNLAGLIRLRVAGIGDDDPQRGRKAFRVFLEAVLLSTLGDTLSNDPKFFQMVDDIQNTMEADPECSALVRTAIGHLLSQRK
jgi:hypothetical protein